MTEPAVPRSMSQRLQMIGAAVAVAAAVAAVLYARAPGGKESAAACAASDAVLPRVAPLETGEVAAATSPRRASPVATLDFLTPDGKPTSLAAFKGRVVLVNLWATWCVPCRDEMPALDKLQALVGSKDFEVVAVNIDTSRIERARDFLRDAGVSKLAFYSDPKADVFYRLKMAGKVVGLPTSILVGRDGCEIAILAGPANWVSQDATNFIRSAL